MEGLRLFGLVAVALIALLAGTVIAGFLYEALGLWATVIYGLALVVAVGVFSSRRTRQTS
jgi:hypothetical protein